jgi:hypothetical protein
MPSAVILISNFERQAKILSENHAIHAKGHS